MFFRSIVLAVSISYCVLAEEKASPKKNDADIQVRFLAEEFPASIGNVFVLAGENKSAPFVLPTNFMSTPVLVGSRSMTLKTESKEVPLCAINLPETGKAFAVVLVTAKPSGFYPVIVRTDDPAFKIGDVLFINRSEKIVLGKLGDTSLVLNPSEVKKSRPTNPRENAFYDIAFATRESDGDKLISTTRWPIDQSLRSYVFFFTNSEGRTTFRAVDEFVTPAVPGKP